MNDLSPKARAVVEVGRDPGVFTQADRDRIRRGLHLRLATLGAATTTAGTAAAMSITAKLALVTAVATLLGGGVVSYWALRGRAPAAGAAAGHSSSLETPAVEAPNPGSIQAIGNVAAGPTPTRLATRRILQTRSERSVAAAVPATEDHAAPPLDSELSLLRQAREDLRTGFPGSAYQRLVDYDSHYGKGPLWQERQALSAIALCQWRPGPQAQVRAAEFLHNVPQSPLADRVRSVCGGVSAAEK
jgi:hypothetical protein